MNELAVFVIGVKLLKCAKMAQKLSIQEKKDLDKFTKFLALKATQIIVQSRLGEKVSTPCKPHTAGTDWVGCAIYPERI